MHSHPERKAAGWGQPALPDGLLRKERQAERCEAKEFELIGSVQEQSARAS